MAEKASDNKIIAGIVVLVAGLFFVGMQTGLKNDQTRIDNLPAIEEKINANAESLKRIQDTIHIKAESISKIQEKLTETLDRDSLSSSFTAIDNKIEALKNSVDSRIKLDRESLKASFEAHNNKIDALDGQLDRRIQLEVKDPIYRELNSVKKEIVILKALVFEHVNHPKSTHIKQD